MLLQPGAIGEDVGRLETRLHQIGLYTGPTDNIFGGGVDLSTIPTDLVQRVEARRPHPAVRLEPGRLFRQQARAEPARDAWPAQPSS